MSMIIIEKYLTETSPSIVVSKCKDEEIAASIKIELPREKGNRCVDASIIYNDPVILIILLESGRLLQVRLDEYLGSKVNQLKEEKEFLRRNNRNRVSLYEIASSRIPSDMNSGLPPRAFDQAEPVSEHSDSQRDVIRLNHLLIIANMIDCFYERNMKNISIVSPAGFIDAALPRTSQVSGLKMAFYVRGDLADMYCVTFNMLVNQGEKYHISDINLYQLDFNVNFVSFPVSLSLLSVSTLLAWDASYGYVFDVEKCEGVFSTVRDGDVSKDEVGNDEDNNDVWRDCSSEEDEPTSQEPINSKKLSCVLISTLALPNASLYTPSSFSAMSSNSGIFSYLMNQRIKSAVLESSQLVSQEIIKNLALAVDLKSLRSRNRCKLRLSSSAVWLSDDNILNSLVSENSRDAENTAWLAVLSKESSAVFFYSIDREHCGSSIAVEPTIAVCLGRLLQLDPTETAICVSFAPSGSIFGVLTQQNAADCAENDSQRPQSVYFVAIFGGKIQIIKQLLLQSLLKTAGIAFAKRGQLDYHECIVVLDSNGSVICRVTVQLSSGVVWTVDCQQFRHSSEEASLDLATEIQRQNTDDNIPAVSFEQLVFLTEQEMLVTLATHLQLLGHSNIALHHDSEQAKVASMVFCLSVCLLETHLACHAGNKVQHMEVEFVRLIGQFDWLSAVHTKSASPLATYVHVCCECISRIALQDNCVEYITNYLMSKLHSIFRLWANEGTVVAECVRDYVASGRRILQHIVDVCRFSPSKLALIQISMLKFVYLGDLAPLCQDRTDNVIKDVLDVLWKYFFGRAQCREVVLLVEGERIWVEVFETLLELRLSWGRFQPLFEEKLDIKSECTEVSTMAKCLLCGLRDFYERHEVTSVFEICFSGEFAVKMVNLSLLGSVCSETSN